MMILVLIYVNKKGSFNNPHKQATSNLVTLLIRVASVAVREMNVAVSFSHDSPDRIATFPYNVGVVCVAYIHLHCHSTE